MRSRMHNRRSDIVILAFSLILAAGMWFIHILSQTYYAYLPFNVSAVSEIQGYAPKSVTAQTVFLGGKARGFFLLGYNLSGKKPREIDVEISPSSFDRKKDTVNTFSISSSKIRDRISESVNSFFEVTFVQDMLLDFTFVPQTFRKVPVNSRIGVTCEPQYMVVSDITFSPDSVTVYGDESVIANISSINTRSVSLSSMNRPSGGVISLEKNPDIRIVPEEVTYSVPVGRYFEYTFDTELSVVNVPAGKKLILLPSRVKVTCRLPFGTETVSFMEDARFVVDYNDVIGSLSSKVSPKMENTDITVYSFSSTPRFVDCIISDYGR